MWDLLLRAPRQLPSGTSGGLALSSAASRCAAPPLLPPSHLACALTHVCIKYSSQPPVQHLRCAFSPSLHVADSMHVGVVPTVPPCSQHMVWLPRGALHVSRAIA